MRASVNSFAAGLQDLGMIVTIVILLRGRAETKALVTQVALLASSLSICHRSRRSHRSHRSHRRGRFATVARLEGRRLKTICIVDADAATTLGSAFAMSLGTP